MTTAPLNLVVMVMDAWLTVNRYNDGRFFNSFQFHGGRGYLDDVIINSTLIPVKL